MVRIAVLISGSGSNLQSLIDNLKTYTSSGKIELVISNRNDAYGLNRAQKANIETMVVKDQTLLLKILKEKKIELVVLAGYLAIISDELIDEYQNRIINIHPSLIPAFCGKGYYGLHVHEAAFKRGVKLSGVSIHFVSKEVDGGPIILQEAIDVSDCDSPIAMQKKVLTLEHRLLPKVVALYCNNKLVVKEEKVVIK